jgi:hypothetical protein
MELMPVRIYTMVDGTVASFPDEQGDTRLEGRGDNV